MSEVERLWSHDCEYPEAHVRRVEHEEPIDYSDRSLTALARRVDALLPGFTVWADAPSTVHGCIGEIRARRGQWNALVGVKEEWAHRDEYWRRCAGHIAGEIRRMWEGQHGQEAG